MKSAKNNLEREERRKQGRFQLALSACYPGIGREETICKMPKKKVEPFIDQTKTQAIFSLVQPN
jgi:hypothetical protein